MDAMLKGLFGGGEDAAPRVRDFVSRYEQGPIDQGYSDDEAFQNYGRVAQHVDPETMQRAAEQVFARMDPQQRAEFAQLLEQRTGGQGAAGASRDPRQLAGMVSRIQRQQPGGLASLFGGVGDAGGGERGGGGGLGGMLGGVLGGGGFPGGTLGKVVLGGIAAYAMKEMLDNDDGGDKKRKRSV